MTTNPLKRFCATASLLFLSCTVTAASDYQKYTTEFLAPAGNWAVNFNFNYGYIDSRHNSDGKLEALGADTSGFALDSLAPLLGDPALDFALANGFSLGTTALSLTYETRLLETTFGYGVTSDFSIGGKFAVGKSCSKAKPSTENTTVPGFDINLLLTGTFGYADADNHCISGLMGPTLAAAWRVYNGELDSIVFMPGIRLGKLADHHDADVLFEPIIDDGSNDIIIRVDYFRDLLYNLDLHAQFEYDIQISDDREMRVPLLPIPLADASAKETLDRKLGNYFIVDLELGYRFLDNQMRSFIAFYQKTKSKDEYTSDTFGRVSVLENNTDYTDREFRVGISYDGIPAWKAGKLPIPLMAELNYWQSYSGENYLEYHWTELNISIAF